MADNHKPEELDLTDAELTKVLKNHGIDRRSLMKVMGVGAGNVALSGTAAGQEGRGNRIDKIYSASYAADEHTVPSGLVDHTVELHIHDPLGDHEGATLIDSPEDEGSAPDNEVSKTFFDPVGIHVGRCQRFQEKPRNQTHYRYDT